jgi:hypothetical protein
MNDIVINMEVESLIISKDNETIRSQLPCFYFLCIPMTEIMERGWGMVIELGWMGFLSIDQILFLTRSYHQIRVYLSKKLLHYDLSIRNFQNLSLLHSFRYSLLRHLSASCIFYKYMYSFLGHLQAVDL